MHISHLPPSTTCQNRHRDGKMAVWAVLHLRAVLKSPFGQDPGKTSSKSTWFTSEDCFSTHSPMPKAGEGQIHAAPIEQVSQLAWTQSPLEMMDQHGRPIKEASMQSGQPDLLGGSCGKGTIKTESKCLGLQSFLFGKYENLSDYYLITPSKCSFRWFSVLAWQCEYYPVILQLCYVFQLNLEDILLIYPNTQITRKPNKLKICIETLPSKKLCSIPPHSSRTETHLWHADRNYSRAGELNGQEKKHAVLCKQCGVQGDIMAVSCREGMGGQR